MWIKTTQVNKIVKLVLNGQHLLQHTFILTYWMLIWMVQYFINIASMLYQNWKIGIEASLVIICTLCPCFHNQNNSVYSAAIVVVVVVVVVVFRSHSWSARRRNHRPQSSLDKPPCSLVCWHDSTMCDIVWISPQEHWSESESFHFFLQTPQWPCQVRKRFRRDHCCNCQWVTYCH